MGEWRSISAPLACPYCRDDDDEMSLKAKGGPGLLSGLRSKRKFTFFCLHVDAILGPLVHRVVTAVR